MSMTTQRPAHATHVDGCIGREESGEALLDRSIGPFSAKGATVEEISDTLLEHHVPLSFVQADVEATISVELGDATVRNVLDAVVARAPGYRYGVIDGRLVLYPRDQKWTMPLEGVKLGPSSRLGVGIHLADELRRRAPGLARLAGPTLAGNGDSFVYSDVVAVATPASVIDLFVQLLGQRASAIISVTRGGGDRPELTLSGVELLQSLLLTAETTTLRDRTATAQLKLLGKLYGDKRLDLTAGSCGTTYSSSDEKVIAVSADGLVTVRGSGKAVVTARNEGSLAGLLFTVILPTPPDGPPLARRLPKTPDSLLPLFVSSRGEG
jgi:hypothetical protein